MELTQRELDKMAVRNFREYLRIPSVHPNVNYDECVAFLRRQAMELDLPIQIYELAAGKPIVIITWLGEEPGLPSILLNSHMDVVPVSDEHWTYPPFGAVQDEEGNIYGRGAQDMKGTGIQYLETVRRLKAEGIRVRRTIHISYMPDEEIGGEEGMKKFVLTQKFRDLNIGFAFDEGLAHPENVIPVTYGERSVWQLTFHCYGKTGSLATPLNDTAGQKVRVILDRAMEFRQAQKEKLQSDPSLTAGDVTSLNLTMMEGGASSLGNVPEQLSVTFDIRLAVTEDHEKMLAKLQSWCEEVGPETCYTFSQKDPYFQPTRIDNSNPWWLVFKAECNNLGLNIEPVINPPAGDSRHLRMVGVPTLGFAPMCNTPMRMHEHDEFLNEDVFLRGIRIYCRLLTAVANLAPSY